MTATGATKGIDGYVTSLGREPHNDVIVYVQVGDLATHLERAVKLRGKVLIPGLELPTGSLAWLADPEGAVADLWKPKSKTAPQ